MPPKRSGKGRNKAESVKSVLIVGDEVSSRKNGRVDENEALELESNAEVVDEETVMVPEVVRKRGRPKSRKNKTVISEEQLNGEGEAIDPETGHFKNGHHEDDMNVKAVDIGSESDAMANTEQEAKTKTRAGRKEDQSTNQKRIFPETKAPKNARGRKAQQHSSKAACKSLVSEEKLESDEQETKEITHETKEITSQEIKDGQNDKQLSSDFESVKDKDSVPKKAKGRLDKDKSALQKTKNAKQSSAVPSNMPGTVGSKVDTEPKEVSKGVRGRKRKNVQTEIESGEVLERSKAAIGNRVLKVSLLRQKSVDNMALEEMKKSEGKVKAAVGTSNTRGKRGREGNVDALRSALLPL